MKSEEIVYLVDKNDNIIGTKPRNQLTDEDCWRDVAIWVEDSSHTYTLVQQRSSLKKYGPNTWTCAAAGTVEYPESYLQTATREVYEEIGLHGCELAATGHVHAKHSFGYRVTHGFAIICDWNIDDFRAQTSEVAQLEWVPRNQVISEISGNQPHTRPWPPTAKLWISLFNLA